MLTLKMFEIARLVYGLMQVKGKQYHVIDRDWMLKTLEKRHKVKMSASCLDKSLAKLRELGILHSKTRHIKGDAGQFIPRPSLYLMTSKLKKMFTALTRGLGKLAGTGILYQICNGIEAERKAARDAQNERLNRDREPPTVPVALKGAPDEFIKLFMEACNG